MKAAIVLLISLFLIGCGSRSRNVYKTEEKTTFDNETSIQETKSVTSEISSITDIRNFLFSNGLKIKSNGQNYELKYGDLTFSGSADIEFSQRKEEKVIHNVYKVHTTYITETKFQTKTFFKTDKTTKNLNVERSGVSFGSMVWIVIFSLISGVVLWELAKRLILRK
ncbi:hypothetical protein [Chryseobacterium sp. SG20098]|uniref:hypothetical protein n=1 Tax=Chryseobacterium sp. SG20098 TaxID=3074145 RepID=UPI002882E822|nr:hypothetical protein [Chryseobacterium sp. SG20098]WNI34733.1 hypothetical protein RHP76_12165 [Chryseobacterium sp. SG20098]